MIFIAAVIVGILLGIVIPYNLTSATLPYVAVAIVAALDSVFGGLVANFNKKFNMNIFITGLVSNAILAVIITFMGNLLGISLYFAAIVVFGVRIFNNMASIRRITTDIYFERKARENERKKRLAISEHAIGYNMESDENENTEKAEEKTENKDSDSKNEEESDENKEK